MEYVIIGLVFLGICVNLAMAGRYLFGYRFDNESRLKQWKRLKRMSLGATVILNSLDLSYD